MKQENYEAVKPYETQMETAVKANWARNLSPSVAATFEAVWKSETGDISFHLHRNCSACILDILQRVGRMYFEHQAEEKPKVKRNGSSRNKQQQG